MQVGKRLKAQCPFCTSEVLLSIVVEQWDIVTCNECLTELQVVTVNPPELDYAWDDDSEDDDLEWDYDELDYAGSGVFEDDWEDESDSDDY